MMKMALKHLFDYLPISDHEGQSQISLQFADYGDVLTRYCVFPTGPSPTRSRNYPLVQIMHCRLKMTKINLRFLRRTVQVLVEILCIYIFLMISPVFPFP